MTTKAGLIQSALGELGLASYFFDATPEQLQEALSRMNRFAAMLDGLSVHVGYNFGGDINAESGIPDTTEDCFVSNTAVRIAPTFGKTPSNETKLAAKTTLSALLTTFAKRPQQAYPPNLPIGAGNRRGVLERQYFPETSDTEGIDAGATEY